VPSDVRTAPVKVEGYCSSPIVSTSEAKYCVASDELVAVVDAVDVVELVDVGSALANLAGPRSSVHLL
jgi:hypothetical protein